VTWRNKHREQVRQKWRKYYYANPEYFRKKEKTAYAKQRKRIVDDPKYAVQYKNKVKLRWKRFGEKVKAAINNLKSRPCVDCKKRYPPWVMDFDHRPGSQKSFTMAHALKDGMSLKRLLEEAKKCDVVCANCHRQRTQYRLLRSEKMV
jgi:hypothetical protein